jgi:hypothetical protein
MICATELSVSLLLIEKFLRRFRETTDPFAKGIIGNFNGEPLVKAGDPKSNTLSEVSTRLVDNNWIYAS